MKQLILTNGDITLVDDDIYETLNQYKWRKDPWGGYAVRTVGPSNKRYLERIHRIVMSAKDGIMIDHIDGNVLNNQRSNLRLANHSTNAMNKKIPKNNTSGYKGVSLVKATSKWKAVLKLNGKEIYLGSYKTKEEAAIAYNNGAIKYFGNFASINKVKEIEDAQK